MRAAPAATGLALALLVGCTAEEAPPEIATTATGVASYARDRAMVFHGTDQLVDSPRLFAPAGAMVLLEDWEEVSPPPAPVPAAIYLPSCSTPAAPPEHIPFLMDRGVAVVVPKLGGLGCVDPEDSFGNLRAEIEDLAWILRDDVPWIADDRVYLVGHSVGADLATSFATPGIFKGVIGISAACTFGVNEATPTLTFRALDDPVLAIRQTRCTALDASPNALHLEFAGSDHVMRLTSGDDGGRRLVRSAIAQFMGVGAAPAAPAIADADALDLQQLSSPVEAAEGGDPAPSDAPARDAPAVDERLLGEAPEEPAGPTPTASDGEMLFLPTLNLPAGQL